MKAVINTAATIQPVTLYELIYHLRIDEETNLEDDYLYSINKAATSLVEDITRRALLTQTWDFYLDSFPSSDAFKLPFGNLQSVTHVKYTDSDGTQTTMTVTTDYLVETNGDACGRIVLPYGETWPSFTAYPSNPIVVRFVCGWTTRDLVPYPIKAAIKLICADLYTNRESQFVSMSFQKYELNPTVQRLLASYRLWEEF